MVLRGADLLPIRAYLLASLNTHAIQQDIGDCEIECSRVARRVHAFGVAVHVNGVVAARDVHQRIIEVQLVAQGE